MSELTESQRYVLTWIAEHGGRFQNSAHPDFWRRLGVPGKLAQRFKYTTLRILVEQGYLESNGGFGVNTVYNITAKGRAEVKKGQS